MNRFGYIAGILALLLVAGISAVGCGKEEEATVQPGAPVGPAPAAEVQIAQTSCPVMGLPIDKDIYVDHKGRRVYFCCQMCVDKFKEDPETYLKKLDEQLQKAPEAGGSEEHAAQGEHEVH